MSEPTRAQLAAYDDVLLCLRGMDEDDLQRAIDALSPNARRVLADGPMTGRVRCRVCLAIGDDVRSWEHPVDLSDPRWRVWIYHEIPKGGTLREGYHKAMEPECANAIYERCLAIYRAAGWDGEAPPPDAGKALLACSPAGDVL